MTPFDVNLVFSDLRMTRLMRSGGAFEDFKVVLGATIAATLSKAVDEKMVEAIRINAESAGYGLVAVVGKQIHYRDPKVKSVSDGEKWCPADDYLNSLVQT